MSSQAVTAGSIPERRDTSILIAEFVAGLTYEELSTAAVAAARNRLLDTLACGIGAIDVADIAIVRNSISMNPDAPCTLLGCAQRSSPAEAAMLNTGMTRNLDYMDSYVGPHGGGHPSNCIAPIIACSEFAGASTKEVLVSIVAATEVLGAFADKVNSRARSGVEHLGYVGIAMTAGAGRALGLDVKQLQNALSLTAASYNPLQVTRSEQITMWKGFAAGYAALIAVNSAILARNGMVGPHRAFDGNKGWKKVVARQDFDLEFTCGERIHAVWTKLYLAETYALSAVEGAIELARQHDIHPAGIDSVLVRSFSNAVSRLGEGEGRDPYRVTSRPEADHSFPYVIAAALLDGELSLSQYTEERIRRDDVQELLRKIRIVEDEEFTGKFVDGRSPAPAGIDVMMKDGTRYSINREYFSGHPAQPATRDQIIGKLDYLGSVYFASGAMQHLVNVVENLEEHTISDLTDLFPRRGSGGKQAVRI